MIRLLATTLTICLFAMPALAWDPPILTNPQETCRIEKSVEQSSYTDSIRLTYTVMRGVPMNVLFGNTPQTPFASKIIEDWQVRMDDPNFKIGDYALGVGGVRLNTTKRFWDIAFKDILDELRKPAHAGWHYRDLYLKLDEKDTALYDAFGELATLGFDLAFMGVSKNAAKELLDAQKADESFYLDANCGLLDMWDLYTACVGEEGMRTSDYYTKTVFYARKAFRLGILWQNSPFPHAINYMNPADTSLKIASGSSSKCCNTANVCQGPSHETCATCGSYCCMGCVPCY